MKYSSAKMMFMIGMRHILESVPNPVILKHALQITKKILIANMKTVNLITRI